MKALYVVKSVKQGGAETMMHNICSYLDRNIEIEILSLSGLGAIGERIKNDGFGITDLGLPSTREVDLSLPETCEEHVNAIRRKIIDYKPDVVMSWLMKADGLSTMAIKGLSNRDKPDKFLWNVQGINPELYVSDKELEALKKMSYDQTVNGIIYCGHTVKNVHENSIGYTQNKGIVIPNAVNRDKFTFDKGARYKLRDELEIPKDNKVIVMAARFKEMKDVPTFISSVSLLCKMRSNISVIMCGQRMEETNENLMSLIEAEGIKDKVRLLGIRDDIPDLYSASDVFMLPSKSGEGLSLALVEGMSSGLFPFVTPVGDSARVVNDKNYVCSIGDAQGFANKIDSLLSKEKSIRDNYRIAIKDRSEDFSISSIGPRYQEALTHCKIR